MEPPSRADWRFLTLFREALRIIAAFGIYLLLSWLAEGSGAAGRYWATVSRISVSILEATRHFRDLPETGSVIPANQHSHLALLLALFLVSWRIPLGRRVKYFGLLAVLAVLQDVTAASLSLKLHLAKALFNRFGWVELLPWEYNAIQLLWYVLYALPLEAVPFLLMFLTILWNQGVNPSALFGRMASPASASPSAESPRPKSKSPFLRRLAGSLTALVVIGLTWTTWRAWLGRTERDPLHLKTHVMLGRMHLLSGEMAKAEAEFRHAVASGTLEGEAWVQLAVLLDRRGRRGEAVDLLRRAAAVVGDTESRNRIGAALESMGSTDPYRPPPIVSVQPPETP